MNYVIIGNSAAAISAVEGIRQVDEKGSIIIISDEPYHTYSRPLISYYLAGKVTQDKMNYRPEEFYKKYNVKALLGTKALLINTANKFVETEQGNIPYDKLLIATGGKPAVPPIPGIDKAGVNTFIKLDDVKKIKELSAPGKKAVIIGAGLIGLKAAEALVQLEVDTTVVELSDYVLSSILDAGAAQLVKTHLESQGVNFYLGSMVTEIRGDKNVSSVILNDKTELEADFVIVAVGVTPNLDVIEGSEIKCNRGIIVNKKLETNLSDIYAAGDVAEGYDLLNGEKRVLPILPNAYFQGEVAGKNMAGKEETFKGGIAMNSIGFFGLPMITAGIVNPESDDYEILVDEDNEQNYYRKIILRDNMMVGFILLNGIDRSGILTSLIRERVEVGSIKYDLLKPDFGFINLTAEFRKAKLLGGMTQ